MKLARSLGNIGQIVLCSRVTTSLQIIDPNSLQSKSSSIPPTAPTLNLLLNSSLCPSPSLSFPHPLSLSLTFLSFPHPLSPSLSAPHSFSLPSPLSLSLTLSLFLSLSLTLSLCPSPSLFPSPSLSFPHLSLPLSFPHLSLCPHPLSLAFLPRPSAAEISSNVFWRTPFSALCNHRQLTEFYVVNIESVEPHTLQASVSNLSEKVGQLRSLACM